MFFEKFFSNFTYFFQKNCGIQSERGKELCIFNERFCTFSLGVYSRKRNFLKILCIISEKSVEYRSEGVNYTSLTLTVE